jgi:hypothetical protein
MDSLPVFFLPLNTQLKLQADDCATSESGSGFSLSQSTLHLIGRTFDELLLDSS